MSQIFDGLQRLESDRFGIDGSSARVTELLQVAERRATSKWEGAASEHAAEIPNESGEEGSDQSFPVATSVSVGDSFIEQNSSLFGEFRSLPLSLSTETQLPCLTDIGSPADEAFRLLGVRLRNLRRDRTLRRILITSTIPQEGKSMVTANLACTLARKTKQKILMLEGDLRRPSLSKMFGIGKNSGVCELLEGECSLARSIYHLERPNVWILPAGSAPSNALELLQSGRLATLMEQLSALFDWIIIDSPPILPLADTSVWMRLADGILLATRQGTTEKRKLQRGLEAIEIKKLIGALVNSSNHAGNSDYYYYGPTTGPKLTDTSVQ